MIFDRFMIAPNGFTIGLETDKRPWLIPDEAFEELTNCYVFRGRVRKRFGSYLMGGQLFGDNAALYSRLRIMVGMTDGTGALSGTVPGNVFAVGQLFSIGTEIFTVYQTGTPATMYTTGSSATHTYNTSTGAYVFAGATPSTAVYFYPATSVMGLTMYERGPVNSQPTYAFDIQFAYVFTMGSWSRSGTVVFHGTDDDFFWTTNWTSITADTTALFVTNFNATVPTPAATDDPMWYFDGTTWTQFSPLTIFLSDGSFVQTARIIVVFKDRLLLLNTIEQSSGVNYSFVNRCRFSHVGSPIATNAWLEPNQSTGGQNADGAGFTDAPTEEEIISAEFIKDRLIVYFERSTWELAFTNNQIDPFLWQKINTELGSEATFSTVPFDKVILTIGNTGVHACSGSNVERIDNKIPDKIFNIEDKSSGVSRVAGIRDYFSEMVYWTFPDSDRSATFYKYPNKILVYNYQNSSWAFNDDTITTWGYFEQQSDITWATNDWIWSNVNNEWESGETEANFRQVIAGNQQGFVFVIAVDTSRNSQSLQITNISADVSGDTALLVINHNLDEGDYVLVEACQGYTTANNNIYEVVSVVDVNNIILDATYQGNPYTGGGTLARVSNVQIRSKQWNPYVNQGQNVYLSKIDFGVLKTSFGQITVDYWPSSTEFSMLIAGESNGSIMGNGILETSPYALVPLEQLQERLWHTIYFQSEGECIQLYMYFDDTQMMNRLISLEDFQLEGMVLHTAAVSTRLQ